MRPAMSDHHLSPCVASTLGGVLADSTRQPAAHVEWLLLRELVSTSTFAGGVTLPRVSVVPGEELVHLLSPPRTHHWTQTLDQLKNLAALADRPDPPRLAVWLIRSFGPVDLAQTCYALDAQEHVVVR